MRKQQLAVEKLKRIMLYLCQPEFVSDPGWYDTFKTVDECWSQISWSLVGGQGNWLET